MMSTKQSRALTLTAIAGIAAVVFATGSSCNTGPADGTPQAKADALRDQTSKQQEAAVPYPADKLRNPLDRKNLADRLISNNDPNKISYVYLISMTGEPYAYFVFKGKLTSTESTMLPTDAIIDACNSTEYCPEVVQGGGDDGTYGQNEDAVFGWTVTGVMVTLKTDNWLQTDQPIEMKVPDITPKKK